MQYHVTLFACLDCSTAATASCVPGRLGIQEMAGDNGDPPNLSGKIRHIDQDMAFADRH